MKKEIQPPANRIVFLGENGFPVGLAAIQRMTLMAKALIHGGFQVTVICRKGVFKRGQHTDIGVRGTFEGIEYCYTSKDVFRPLGFLNRNWAKLKGMYGEYRYLLHLKKSNKLKAAIISSHSAVHVFRYKVYAMLIGFPIILNFVELASSMKGRDSFITKLNDRIFDNYIVKLVDGALPISEVLLTYYRKLAPSRKSLKLPILCDFDKFDPRTKDASQITFLYCGAASYVELVDFIIQAYEQLEQRDKVFLDLVLGGKAEELKLVEKRIEQSAFKDSIRLITNVPHNKIPSLYATATALLIPLRPTMQDAARFPHKIGEYLASGRPMITSAYGEINHYDFIDQKTALIGKCYEIEEFSQKMRYVLEHPHKSQEIGIQGREMGYKNFHYSKHSDSLRTFLEAF